MRADPTVDQAIAWLRSVQQPSGEFTSVASPLGAGEPVWLPDSLKFITALVVLALDEIPHPQAVESVDRAVAFLWHERETMAQWRYWAVTNPQYDFTPPDADDTACCSLAVATRGRHTARNHAVLLANRDPEGRFYTWLLPRTLGHDPRWWWATRDERRAIVRRRRAELWSTTEAKPDDVDGVVNTNVIRYLGPHAPRAAVNWIRSIVERGIEDDCDSWHRNRYSLYASVADAHRRGVRGLAPIAPTIVDRIAARVDADGTVGPPLDTAMALLALGVFHGDPATRTTMATALRDSQRHDGSWQGSVFYYGGPDEVFGWASEALTTAIAVQALAREARPV